MFDLRLDAEPEISDGARFYRGAITIGAFSEEFLAAAWLWAPDRYRMQWRQAARRLVAGAPKSGFITSFVHPDARHNVVWPAWREGDNVLVQQQLLLRSQISTVLDPDRIERFVGDRVSVTEQGQRMSEWVVAVADLAAFGA